MTDKLSSAEVLACALMALEAALEAGTDSDAILDARLAMAGLDEAGVRRVAACLAVLAGRKSLPARGRLERVRGWLTRWRCELSWREP